MDEVITSINFCQWNNGSMDFYTKSTPVFDNICGSTTTTEMLSWKDDCYKHCIKYSRTSFGHCMEIFTVHGNITIRKDCKNATHTISLKGVRDIGNVLTTVKDLIGESFIPKPKEMNPLHISDNIFGVHMCVVTSMIGKRISVIGDCLLERMIDGMDCGIDVMMRINDENNAVILKVSSWALMKRYSTINLSDRDEFIQDDEITNTIDEFEGSDNTITVSSKGAVIIRISWDSTILWTNKIEMNILSYCKLLCNTINDCC